MYQENYTASNADLDIDKIPTFVGLYNRTVGVEYLPINRPTQRAFENENIIEVLAKAFPISSLPVPYILSAVITASISIIFTIVIYCGSANELSPYFPISSKRGGLRG